MWPWKLQKDYSTEFGISDIDLDRDGLRAMPSEVEKENISTTIIKDMSWLLDDVRLPFVGGLIAPNQGLFPEYDVGLYTKGDTSMEVSRGIGNSIILIRFHNCPEIVVVELLSE